MELELTIKYYTNKAFMYGIFGLFSLFGLIGLIFFPEVLEGISLLARIIPCAILFVLVLVITVVMRNSCKLRHAKPWNAVIIVIHSILGGLLIIFSLLVKQSILSMHSTKSASGEIGIRILFAFYPPWFIALCLSQLAIVMHIKFKNKNINSWPGIFHAYLAFVLPFAPLYTLFSLALAQSALALAISVHLFVLLGFLCTFLTVKGTARRIRCYLAKCSDKKQEPYIFDLIYKSW